MNLTDFLGMFGAAGIVIVGIVVLIVAVLGFLLPVFVFMINGKLRRLNNQIEELILSSDGGGSKKIAGQTLAEAQKQNDLLRQLLRSYGHQPEV